MWWPFSREKTKKLEYDEILIRPYFNGQFIVYRAYTNHPTNKELCYPNFYSEGNTPVEALLTLMEYGKDNGCIIKNINEKAICKPSADLIKNKLNFIKNKKQFENTFIKNLLEEVLFWRKLFFGDKA